MDPPATALEVLAADLVVGLLPVALVAVAELHLHGVLRPAEEDAEVERALPERHLADDLAPAVYDALQERLQDDVRVRLVVFERRLVHARVLPPEVLEREKKPLHVEPVLTGEDRVFSRNDDDYRYVLDLGLLVEGPKGQLIPANPMYAETIGRYLTRDDQDDMKASVPETPWVREDGLDMAGLLSAFQDFWRENAGMNPVPFEYNEAYPHIVLQAFLQRVINGGGEIVREMALGKGALDLGVLFRGAKYAVEVKLLYRYERDREKAYDQICRYMDHLGVDEGWLVVIDPDLTKPWDGKIRREDLERGGRRIHLYCC